VIAAEHDVRVTLGGRHGEPRKVRRSSGTADSASVAPQVPPARTSLNSGESGKAADESARTVTSVSGRRSATRLAYTGALTEPALTPRTTTSTTLGNVSTKWSSAAD